MRSLSFQFAPQFEVIVNLAVEDECVITHPERLVRTLARVEDAQSAVTQNDVLLVRPNPLRIRPTVRQGTDHGAHVLASVIQTSKRLESVNACDATHESARFAVFALPFKPSQPWACNGTSGPFFVTSVKASGAATAWPITDNLGWLRTFS